MKKILASIMLALGLLIATPISTVAQEPGTVVPITDVCENVDIVIRIAEKYIAKEIEVGNQMFVDAVERGECWHMGYMAIPLMLEQKFKSYDFDGTLVGVWSVVDPSGEGDWTGYVIIADGHKDDRNA